MKIVVAMDAFKDCLTSGQACQAVAEAITLIDPEVQVACQPMADGGEGTALVLMAARNGRWIERQVTGPLRHTQVRGGFVWFEDTATALVETASASGLELLRPEDRDPAMTSTYGTGELIKAAADYGASKILLAAGGSATVDLGTGMAAALGWQFLDTEDRPVEPNGKNLVRITTLVPPASRWQIPVEVLCDDSNPLLGPNGAARVFGPRKGADRQTVVLLEVGLTRVSELILRQLHIDIRTLAKGGAAGGLGAGALAFLNASLTPGAEVVIQECRLPAAIEGADWLITGEGRFDGASLQGKVIAGIAHLGRDRGIRVMVFAGQVQVEPQVYRHRGIAEAVACTPADMPMEIALPEGRRLLLEAARQWASHVLNVGV